MSAARQPIGPMSQFVPNLHHCIWFCFTFEIDANSYRNASVKRLVCSLRLKNLKTERRKGSEQTKHAQRETKARCRNFTLLSENSNGSSKVQNRKKKAATQDQLAF